MDQLVARAKTGDRTAEEELFGQLLVRFERFAARRVGDESAVEVAQQACVTVLQKYRTQELDGEFGAWAYGVLRMVLKRYRSAEYRHQERETVLPDGVDLPARSETDPLLRSHLLDCMRWLVNTHARYARILNLHRQGYDTAEVCQRVGLNRDQYYVYLGRSRGMLRDCLVRKGVAI